MKRMLFTRQFKLFRGYATESTLKSLAKFVEAELGYSCVFEKPWERLQWQDFDAVFLSTGLLDKNNDYCLHFAKQLVSSMGTKLQRFIDVDDVYYPPMSVLKQLGLSDDNEFTHVFSLFDEPLMYSTDFIKYPAFQSDSFKTSNRVYGPLWSYTELGSDLAIADISKLEHDVIYTGMPKADRLCILNELGIARVRKDYLSSKAMTAKSLCTIMLNSVEHYGNLTSRFFESGMLTIQLWHDSASVDHFSPPDNRRFSNRQELLDIVKELKSQDVAARQSELIAQHYAVHRCALAHIEAWRKSDKDIVLSRIV